MLSQFLSIKTVIVRQMLGDGSILTTTTIARHSTSGREEATEDEHVTPNSQHLKPVTDEETTVPSPKNSLRWFTDRASSEEQGVVPVVKSCEFCALRIRALF